MNDKEFLELLNLYIDREISAENAQRLEAEVGSNADRRKVYDQYCRIQKACSMLSGEMIDSVSADRRVIAFPSAQAWRPLPIVAFLAAAACLAAIVSLRSHSPLSMRDAYANPVDSGHSLAAAQTVDVSPSPEAMRPVFLARQTSSQPVQKSDFAGADTASQVAQLDWIGDVHMTPLFTPANPDFLLEARPDSKTTVLSEAQIARDAQETSEMAAFRFQR